MDLLADLGWLRRAPQDFNDRCRALASRAEDPDRGLSDVELIDLGKPCARSEFNLGRHRQNRGQASSQTRGTHAGSISGLA